LHNREIPIKIFLSETICSIRTKFLWNSHWMVLFQKCVWRFDPSFNFFFTCNFEVNLITHLGVLVHNIHRLAWKLCSWGPRSTAPSCRCSKTALFPVRPQCTAFPGAYYVAKRALYLSYIFCAICRIARAFVGTFIVSNVSINNWVIINCFSFAGGSTKIETIHSNSEAFTYTATATGIQLIVDHIKYIVYFYCIGTSNKVSV
jgi:hypothetical protein